MKHEHESNAAKAEWRFGDAPGGQHGDREEEGEAQAVYEVPRGHESLRGEFYLFFMNVDAQLRIIFVIVRD